MQSILHCGHKVTGLARLHWAKSSSSFYLKQTQQKLEAHTAVLSFVIVVQYAIDLGGAGHLPGKQNLFQC